MNEKIKMFDFKANQKVDFLEIGQVIEKNGSVIIKNIISPETVFELKSSLISSIEEDEKKRGKDYIFYGMIHALMARNQSFLDLLTNSTILSLVRAILGKGAIVHAYNSSSMPPAGSNFSRSIHVDCPRLIPNYISNMGITIALDKFTNENGAMEIISDSFHQEKAPSEAEFEQKMFKLNNLEAGDAIFFNARCWHRGGINTTNDWRHAVTINCCRAFMRQQFDFPTMFSEEKSKEFSEDLKQFLGYFVRIPKSMEDFLLPADKRLYKSGQE